MEGLSSFDGDQAHIEDIYGQLTSLMFSGLQRLGVIP